MRRMFNGVLAIVLSAALLPAIALGQIDGPGGGDPSGGGSGGDPGGGFGGATGGHLYADFYPGDEYLQVNPAAEGSAVIDRSDTTDYPTIYFSSYADFATSVTFELETWQTFFPLGVNVAYVGMVGDEVTAEKFVVETEPDQVLFADETARQAFLAVNPAVVVAFA